MPKILPAVFSYEDMKKRFAQDNPDDPYTRRADLESGIYELDRWIIRVDDNDKAISTVGWKEHPSHTVVGGMYATEYGESLGGNSRALQDAREPQLNQSKPLVAAFGHRRGDNARWISNAKRNGWSFPDSDNWEQMSKLIPNDVLNAWLSKYPERMAIRSIRGEGEFAKCVYLDDPIPSWFSLIKYYPDDSFEHLDIAEPIPDLGTRSKFKDMDIKSLANVDKKGIVTEEYLRQVYNRISEPTNTMMNDWLERIHKQNLSRGKYWFFATKEKSNKTYVTFNMINKGDKYLPTSSKKLNIVGMDNAVVFVGVSKDLSEKDKRGQYIPAGRKFVDIWGDGDRRGLIQSLSQRKLPKEPVDIFRKGWEEVLKWRPDETFSSMKGDKIISPNKYSSLYKVLLGGKRKTYEQKGHERLSKWKHYNRTDMIKTWVSILNDIEIPEKDFWFYAVPDENDLVFVDATMKEIDGIKNYIFNSIRGRDKRLKNKYMTYPTYAHFVDIWETGIKEGHEAGNERNVFRQDSMYSGATNHNEVYEIWKVFYKNKLKNIYKQINKIKTAKKQETKDEAFEKIDELEKEIRKQYRIYKRNHQRLYNEEINNEEE